MHGVVDVPVRMDGALLQLLLVGSGGLETAFVFVQQAARITRYGVAWIEFAATGDIVRFADRRCLFAPGCSVSSALRLSRRNKKRLLRMDRSKR